jgi:cytochrome c oxidase assembly protein subunit 15
VAVEHPTLHTRIRRVEITPARFRTIALAALVALFVVVTTGAVVRLTASGLGCDNWPRCGSAPFPAKGSHAFIEFSNRVVALIAIGFTLFSWLASRRLPELPHRVRTLALAIFLGTVAQIPLGGLTVIFHLNPLLVISHFLLALVVLALAVIVAMEAWSLERGRAAPVVPGELARTGLVLVAACLALVVTGTLVTAAGPHSGGIDIRRLGTLSTAIYIHVRATALFGLAFVGSLGYLTARRSTAPRLFRLMLALLAILLVQVGIGEIQWHERLPSWLVLLHVSVAATVWVATVGLAYAFWRPPRPLAPPA